ncbi:MAG: glycine/sarcosine/betaine reductase selenoprotein B family protein [Thermoleophilia bacterium]
MSTTFPAGRFPVWRVYGRFLETGIGQAFLDRGKFLGAGAARLLVPALEDETPWAPFATRLTEARVALVTTGGLYLPPDPPFDVDAPLGDPSFRMIPPNVALSDLLIAHTHYGHQRADRDRNVVFPLDRLREMAADGVIGGLGPRAYSFGFTVQTEQLIDPGAGSAHELARLLAEDGVDAVLFAPA